MVNLILELAFYFFVFFLAYKIVRFAVRATTAPIRRKHRQNAERKLSP